MKIVFVLLLCVTVGRAMVSAASPVMLDMYDCGYCQPEQIHIAFGEKTNDIVITWSTFNSTNSSIVKYGEHDMETQVQGTQTKFVDGGPKKRTQFIHRVTLRNLTFDTRYMYHVGSIYGWSDKFTFRTPPQGENWVVRAAIYGDMGMKNAHSLPYLQEDTENDKYDLILHVGDFAYDMDTDDALVGDQFMRQIEPIAASLPYMVCPGNHEEKYNFSNYKNRFSMPGGEQSMFYSFDLGPVHFVAVSTEFYYYVNYGLKMVANQYEWLVKDLEEASRKENRVRRPWIVLYGHRPMYCSNSDDIDCSYEYTRKGLPAFGIYSIEPLLQQYGVDIVIWAHEHSYERTWPLYDEKVYNGSLEQPYVNPGAPVHIVTGSAGCQGGQDPFVPNPNPWSAFRTFEYGYTRFAAVNRTHVYIDQVSVMKNPPSVIDKIWIVKDYHGPAPAHIVTGSAGCQEGRDRFRGNPFSWSAYQSQDYGYTKFKAYNKTHLYMEQVSVEQKGQMIDSFWLVKDKLSYNDL